jgi:hypothetical protein
VQDLEESRMRHELAGAMLAGMLALAGARLTASPVPSACDQHAGMNGKYVQPSSFAPHRRAYNHAYGAPVAKPILSKRAPHKAKTQPQLHTSPLPAS